eukprot:3863377-Rhodomonas_salina.1
MREKLKYAIFGCAAIDNDNGHPAGVLHDDEGAEAEEEAIENLVSCSAQPVDFARSCFVLSTSCWKAGQSCSGSLGALTLKRPEYSTS